MIDHWDYCPAFTREFGRDEWNFAEISELFENAGVTNFEKLPEDKSVCGKFAKEFNRLNSYLEAAKIQGFKWSKPSYVNENTGEIIDVCIDEKHI